MVQIITLQQHQQWPNYITWIVWESYNVPRNSACRYF